MDQLSSAPTLDIFLIAEHRLLREALVQLLEKKANIRVVGIGRAADFTAEDVRKSRCQILLLDSLGTPCSTALIEELAGGFGDIKIVLFGMDCDVDCFLHAVRLGVNGYVLNDAPSAEIVAAVHDVAQGKSVCPPILCTALFEFVRGEFRRKPALSYREARGKFKLTARQSQLMALLARGFSNKEIALRLNISEFTVKNHLHRIMKQIDAESRYEAVDLVRASGLLHVE